MLSQKPVENRAFETKPQKVVIASSFAKIKSRRGLVLSRLLFHLFVRLIVSMVSSQRRLAFIKIRVSSFIERSVQRLSAHSQTGNSITKTARRTDTACLA